MTSIRKVYPDDFEQIYPLLLEFNNPLLDREGWRELFVRRWRSPEEHVGYCLESGGQVVGFLGTIFSQRQISDAQYKFCNLSTWVVKKEHRGASLLLLFEVLKLKDYTITNFTANRVAKILRRLGFEDLAARLHIIIPLPTPAALFSQVKLYTEPAAIEVRLQGEALTIRQDHAGLKCNHLLVEHHGELCYLVFDIVRKKRLPVARIHYISNLAFFTMYAQRFTWAACLKTHTAGLLVSENLLRHSAVRGALVIPQKQALVYRSASLGREDIDTLYGELQVLGLRT